MADCDWCNDKDPLCAQRLCMAHPGMRGCCAGCVTEQLRAELATVTAESAERGKALDVWRAKCSEERDAHAETRKALEEAQFLVPHRGDGSCCICGCAPSTLESLCADCRVAKCDGCVDLESTRGELAKAEARVKEFERGKRLLADACKSSHVRYGGGPGSGGTGGCGGDG